MLAISEEDLNLADELLASNYLVTPPNYIVFDHDTIINQFHIHDYEVGQLLGQIGNERMIDKFLRDYPVLKMHVLSGLIISSHNELFWKLLGDHDIHDYSFQSSAVMGDNLEIYRVSETHHFYSQHILRASEHNSQRIIEYMKKNAAFDDETILDMFYGYIQGGHLEEAKGAYEKIDDKFRILWMLPWAITSNSLETLIYAEDLYRELTGEDLGSAELENIEIIEILRGGVDLDDAVFYFLDRYPRWISFLWECLDQQPWTLKNVILFFERYDPTFSRAEDVLIKMKKKNENDGIIFDKCAIRWLENHVR